MFGGFDSVVSHAIFVEADYKSGSLWCFKVMDNAVDGLFAVFLKCACFQYMFFGFYIFLTVAGISILFRVAIMVCGAGIWVDSDGIWISS